MFQTQITPQIATPADIDPNVNLADLRQLKTEWIERAEQADYFNACRTVVQQLGRRFEEELHYPHNMKPAWVWHSSNVEITLLYSSTKYIPYLRDYEHTFRMVVVVDGQFLITHNGEQFDEIGDGKQVAGYTWSNIPGHKPAASALFIPGRWILRILHALPEAEESLEIAVFEAQEIEREALLQQLLIGQEV